MIRRPFYRTILPWADSLHFPRKHTENTELAATGHNWSRWGQTEFQVNLKLGLTPMPRTPMPRDPHASHCLALDCGQGGRAGSWCLGPRNVRTTLVMGGFPVRCGPPGRSEERNGRSEERNGRSEERNGRQGGSACRWPQVFHTQSIRLRPMTLFNPVFNFVTPKGLKR